MATMLSEKKIIVSVIIPCRNEEKYIGMCISSIINNDYPKDKLEVLVVDGMSADSTREVIKEYTDKYPWLKLLDNPKRIVPTAMNIGIKHAKGDIIIRMDAHNVYKDDYISKCVQYLRKYNVDNVGGVWVTLPGKNTLIGRSIALALSNPFGIGNAYYRLGLKEPKNVDTVPFGCYKKEVFDKIGLFDEDLIRNQDDEFNLRLTKKGGKILLVPDIVSYYYARDSLTKLWKMFFQYGYFKPLVLAKVGSLSTLRQLIPFLFVVSLIITGISSLFSYFFLLLFMLIITIYSSINIFFSSTIAVKNGFQYVFFLFITFAILHFSYGMGYLKGIWDFILLRKYKKNMKCIQLTR